MPPIDKYGKKASLLNPAICLLNRLYGTFFLGDYLSVAFGQITQVEEGDPDLLFELGWNLFG